MGGALLSSGTQANIRPTSYLGVRRGIDVYTSGIAPFSDAMKGT